MGWWQIRDIDSGRVKFYKDGRKLSGNARPGKDKKWGMYNGDTPAAIMGRALAKIVAEYKAVWDRAPSREEVQACFNFVANAMKFSRPCGK